LPIRDSVNYKKGNTIKELEYGLIQEFDTYDLWCEPITDEIDAFVLRSKEGYILAVYSKDTYPE